MQAHHSEQFYRCFWPASWPAILAGSRYSMWWDSLAPYGSFCGYGWFKTRRANNHWLAKRNETTLIYRSVVAIRVPAPKQVNRRYRGVVSSHRYHFGPFWWRTRAPTGAGTRCWSRPASISSKCWTLTSRRMRWYRRCRSWPCGSSAWFWVKFWIRFGLGVQFQRQSPVKLPRCLHRLCRWFACSLYATLDAVARWPFYWLEPVSWQMFDDKSGQLCRVHNFSLQVLRRLVVCSVAFFPITSISHRSMLER